jgi:plasmid stabilization system protein ParE
MKYRISWLADKDIEQICDYIAQDNVSAADRLDEKIHETIGTLAQFPRMGHTRSDVHDPRFLFWSVGNYVICFRLERETLVVMRVVHGARDFRRLFK